MTSLDVREIFRRLAGKRKEHELKWKLPETKLCAQLGDAAAAISAVRRRARFVEGGEFTDEVYAKQHAEGVYSYFIVRTDKKSGEERLLFEGYQLQEEDKLGVDVESKYPIMQDVERLGYALAFERALRFWGYVSKNIVLRIYDIDGFGAFAEITLPPTKMERQRAAAEQQAKDMFAALGIKPDDVMQTDVISLQYYALLQEAQKSSGEHAGKGLFD